MTRSTFLNDAKPGIGAVADTSYTYKRTVDDMLRREMRGYTESTTVPMHQGLPFRITVKRPDGSDVGVASSMSFEQAIIEAHRLIEADAVARGPVELPPVWWGGVEVVRWA